MTATNNLLKESKTRHVKTERSVLRLSFRFLIVCVLILLAIFLWRLGSAALAVVSDIKALKSIADSGIESINTNEAIALVHKMKQDTTDLNKAAKPILKLAPFFGWIPYLGYDIQTTPIFMETALNLLSAADVVAEPLAPLLPLAINSPDASRAVLLDASLPVLTSAQPQLKAAHTYVADAQKAWSTIDVEKLDPKLKSQAERIDRYLPVLDLGLKGGLLAPELLNTDSIKTFLVLIQNEDELRATGGFISAVATVKILDLEILDMKIQDSYSVDDFTKPYPEPPLPLQQYMLADLWLFRDSNWSPNFPTSAQAAINLYSISHDEIIDGVIAIDQQAIRQLIGALGPIQIQESAEPITADNMVEFARSSWSPDNGETGGEWWAHRKDFMSEVLVAAIGKLEGGLNKEQIINISRAILTAFDQKHLQLYLSDANGEQFVSYIGWDGAQAPSDGDYISVIDTNIGFNKTDTVVEENQLYEIDLRNPFAPEATLVLNHMHTLDTQNIVCRHEPRYEGDYEEMIERCYWDYLRIYVPTGSALLDATPHAIPGQFLLSGVEHPASVEKEKDESGHGCFSTLFLLNPGETLQTSFNYLLPQNILKIEENQTTYRLLIQKQSGTIGIPLNVRVILPPKSKIISVEPEPNLESNNVLEFTFILDADKNVNLAYRAPQ